MVSLNKRGLARVFMLLDEKLCEKTSRADDDQRRSMVVLPEQLGQAPQLILGEIVSDDERVPGEVFREQVADVSEVGIAADAVVELLQQGDGLLRTRLADAL